MLRCDRPVWSRVPRVGPVAPRPSSASWQLGWRSFTGLSGVSPQSPKNISYAPIEHVFPSSVSPWWENHPSSSQPSLLSQQRPTCDRKTSPNVQMSRRFCPVCREGVFGLCFRSLRRRQWPPHPYTHTARINPQNCSTGLFIKPTSSHIACICVCSCSPVAGADGHPHPEDLQGGGGPETMARWDTAMHCFYFLPHTLSLTGRFLKTHHTQ